MAEEPQTQGGKIPMKRRIGHKKGSKAKKKLKTSQGSGGKVKIDNKMKKLFRKRASEYNSDNDEDSAPEIMDKNELPFYKKDVLDENTSDEEGEDRSDAGEENEISEDEDGEIQPGITKFADGCRAFKMAFKKIIKKNVSDDLLGPVLSAHKKLVAEKLAEEESESKVKGEAKKEKHLVGERGHVKPANFLDAHDKFLIGVATKGVVKLFNAVNKAQNAQKGLNPSRSKDAKELRKRRKDAFFSELGRPLSQSAASSTKVHTSTGAADEGPSWAPLRDGNVLKTGSFIEPKKRSSHGFAVQPLGEPESNRDGTMLTNS